MEARKISCTFTGVDQWTSWADLMILHDQFRNVEFSVLYSPKLAGIHPRYPPAKMIFALVEAASANEGKFPNLALHLCGSGVDEAFAESMSLSRSGYFAQLISLGLTRIQINFNASDYSMADIWRFVAWAAPARVITQHNTTNQELWRDLRSFDNHEVLFDASLGRGIAPDTWPVPFPGKRCGYAGGLGPHNIRQELPRIAKAAGELGFWVDMESRVRTEDRFDTGACRQVLEAVASFSAALAPAA